MKRTCDKCGAENAVLAPHTGLVLCDGCMVGLLMEEPQRELEFPFGEYGVWADDDDVIGLTVAKTHPHGYFLVRTEPPFMDAFDEYRVARFLAWCLTNAERLLPEAER